MRSDLGGALRISRRQINANLSDPLSADRRQSQRGNGGTRPDSSPGTPRLNDDPLTKE